MTVSGAALQLQRLRDDVQACTRCELHATANQGVPGEGPANARVMLVGEAPGRNEDKQGRPFVGAAGKFLEELLAIADLKRSDVFITNVVKHWPPENRPPTPEELGACRVYLDRQVDLINPAVIVTLGRFSLGTFFPGSMISKVHGQLRHHEGRYFFNMYHPAAALHQQALRDTLVADMKKLGDYLRGPLLETESSDPGVTEGSAAPEQLTLF